MTEKEFALELKTEFLKQYFKYENISCLYYNLDNIPVDNFDIEKLSKELEQYQLHVSRGCDLGHISQDYVDDWNNNKTIFVYADECDL